MQLAREPFELADSEIVLFYRRLLQFGSTGAVHDGRWDPIDVMRAWDGNESHRNILAWTWRLAHEQVLVAVNYSPVRSQAWLKVETPSRSDETVTMQDALTGATYLRDTQELAHKGLYVDLAPYRAHIMHAG